MTPNEPTVCAAAPRLEAFLDERLPEREETEVREHLDDCPRCRATLDGLVADARAWDGLRDAFASDAPTTLLPTADAGERARDPEIERLLEHLVPSDDPRMLGRIGTYEVCGVVGRGSAGIVLKALDRSLNRTVAVKVLSPAFAGRGPARKRFDREGRAVASVTHEHVVPVHAVEEERGLPYLVMQFVPGGSLQRRIDDDGPFATREVVRLGLQIARGLAAAHAQGIVHRDVKPANVLLESPSGRAMVTDFGLARVADDATVTGSGMIAGTPQYMSPEQASGEAVDARSDLFSLGSVLYAAATGRAPFRSDSVFGTIKRLCESEPTPVRDLNPEIDPWLAAFIGRLLEKDPADRFACAAEVADHLERELAHLQSPGAATPPRPWNAPTRRARKPSRFAVAAALVATAVGVLAFGAERYGLLGPTEPDEPGRAATDGPAGGARALASLLPAPSALGDPAATPKDVRDLRKAPSTGGGSSPTAASPDPAEALSAADEAGRPGELVAVHGAFPGGIVDGYSLYLPRSYGDGDTTYPTIVFLTGGCGVGGEVGDLACWGLPKRIAERVDEEDDDLLSRYDRLLLDTFIVIAPHMTGGSYEERQFYDQEEAIARILDRVAAEHRVDEERVYLTGAGRGGHGTWGLASRMPDRFAAIAPIRGFLDGVVDWDALAELPIWTAHRVEDDQVPYAESAAAVTRLEDAGGEAFLRLDALDASDADLDGTSRVFTTIATDEGGSWPNLYERPEFFDWLLRFRRPAASGEEPREL